jgi:anti-sigma B factor antagonist
MFQEFSESLFSAVSAAIPVTARNVCITKDLNPPPTSARGGQHVTEMGNQDSLTIERDKDGVITVHGDIDVAGGPILDAAIREREGEGEGEGDGTVIIDLGDVFFIDSSGLRSLLGASRRARERATTVTLRHVGAEVLRLLEITGTTAHFTIEDRS